MATERPGLRAFEEGEMLVLFSKPGDSVLLRLAIAPVLVEGRGVVDLSGLVGAPPGSSIDWAGKSFRAFRPTIGDLLFHLRRRAQIITPKDAFHLLYLAGIGPGAIVAEAGSGSGALTVVLAHAVGPTGKVHSFDRRADFLKVARENVDRSGLSSRVVFHERDVQVSGFDQQDLEAIVLDVAEPWNALRWVRDALQPGGRVVAYTPTYNQLEQTVRTARELGFQEVRSVELLERALHVGEGGTRPEFEMLGHTGFLTTARRLG
jgi:tRNA (adenine57-N1/adenine58-N1)-methyltransferase catalytic subunit